MPDHALPLVLAISLLAPVSANPAQAGTAPIPPVRPDHPRIFITRDDLPRLKRQLAAYPSEWERTRSAALWEPRDPGYGDARGIRCAAFAYAVTGEERYLNSAFAFAHDIVQNHKLDQYASPEAVFGLALAYDWCYQGLTAAQREEIAGGILRLAAYLSSDRIWRHSDFNNHFVLEKVWPLVMAGLALHGDRADPQVGEMLRLANDYLHQHLLPAANLMAGSSGGQHEGYGYDSWGYARPMFSVLEAWRTATGEDLFPSCSAGRYNALWNIHGRRPFDGRQEHFDDAGLEHAWSQANEGEFIYLLASRYRDGHAQWMGDQIARRYDSYLWPVLLWRDPELAPQAPDDLPTARLFDGLGWVLMRSSWSPDATFASFQCGPFLTGHQHLDNNAFTIHKRALLAIDPGVNAYGENVQTGYRENYYSRSIAHNTITVLDPNETFPGGAWAGGRPGAANDGGQLRMVGAERVEEVTPGSRFEVGRIAAHLHQPLFTYVVGDATKSYSPAKLDLFLRHFLYLPPDVFVIFDQVRATRPEFRKAWLLHSVTEPEVSGSLIAITNAPGRLVSRTVLPERVSITKVGGPGKECWVDGRNWPAVEKEWTSDAGAWRAEVSPSLPAAEDLFLHVIQVDGSDITAPDAVTLVREPGRVGVRVRAQGREYVALFSTHGEAGGHLRIADEGKTLLDQELR